MSVIRPQPPDDPLGYDPAAVFATGAVPRSSFDAVCDRLDEVRDRLLAEAAAADARDMAAAAGTAATDTAAVSGEATPGLAFVSLPERLLAEYRADRPASRLFAILQAARTIREAVDRLVVVGGGGVLAGMRAVVASCCHPLHDALARGDRGGRPRLSFVAAGLDNDSLQALLDLVAPAGRPRSDDLLDRWALLVAGVDDQPQHTAAARRLLLAALRDAAADDPTILAARLVAIDRPGGRIAAWGRALGGAGFMVPPGLAGPEAVLSAAGLVPAAVAGVDVVRLLEGAAALAVRFREAPKEDNPVLLHAAIARLAEVELGCGVRLTCCWSPRLEWPGRWHDQLVGGRAGRGAVPLTIVAPRDLPAHAPRPQERRGSVLVTNLRAGEPRCDPLAVPAAIAPGVDPPPCPESAAATLPALLAVAEAEARDAAALARRPSADILLPRVDEHAIGQLLQLLMLSAAVEDRLARPAARSRSATLRDLEPARVGPGG